MIKEIGSEFWEANCSSKDANYFFQPQIQWFLCGRSALQAIVSELKDKKTVAMPSWCCHTMIKPFLDAGIQVFFYPVYYTDHLVQEIRYDCDILYVMDYFGFSSNMIIEHPCVIRDVTHSLFSKSYDDGDYYYGSLRKWCGVWTGGYSWTKDGHLLDVDYTHNNSRYISLRKKGMMLKKEYIGDTETFSANKSVFLSCFNKAEEYLENCSISPATERDIEIAQNLDVSLIRNKRRNNAKILMEGLSDFILFKELKQTDVPLFVPIIVPRNKRDSLKQFLIDNSIYCPCHWPISDYHVLDEKMRKIYEQEISVVCDQRYGSEEMVRIVNTINSFLERE